MIDETWTGLVADGGESFPIIKSTTQFEGKVWSIRTDVLDFDGRLIERDIVIHPGAVAVIAIDADDRVLLIRQYRHPLGMYIFEPPAGLLDVAGEPPLLTAQRELAEESGYAAKTWHTLADFLNSPGGSSEAIRIYLARDLQPLPGGRPHTGEAEEAFLPRVWVELDEAKDLVLAGTISGPTAVAGILAAWVGRDQDWSNLRSCDEPWNMRSALLAKSRVPLDFDKKDLA
jgi:ADP-ribose pyrophosphatase